MTTIIFKDKEGGSRTLEAEPGTSLMQVAVENMVPGIIAECGGYCACATCHVEIDAGWVDKLQAADEIEAGMLQGMLNLSQRSRLACQIKVTPEIDGLVVSVPDAP
jgi:2Fe-2S ferredoxin